MTVRDRVCDLIEGLSDSDLLVLERIVRGLKLPRETVPAPASEKERQARVDALFGSLPRLPTVDEFLREKREDTEREEERLGQSGGGRAA